MEGLAMIVRINGRELAMAGAPQEAAFQYDTGLALQKAVNGAAKFLIPTTVFMSAMNTAGKVFAAVPGKVTIIDRVWPLIETLQDFALPVGIGVSIWGLIEIMIGNPGGKQKLKYAIMGYIGIFIVPFLFYEIHDAFQGVGKR
jgi:hypothetical protein